MIPAKKFLAERRENIKTRTADQTTAEPVNTTLYAVIKLLVLAILFFAVIFT
jgi:hypothetical protein